MLKSLLITAASCFLLWGCSTTQTQYLLHANALPSSNQAQGRNVFALRSLSLPEYLTNQPNLVYLQDNNISVVDNAHLWTQNLRQNIRQVLGQEISAAIARPVYLYPLSNNLRPNRILDIQIASLIANQATHTLNFSATWQVATPRNHRPPNYQFTRQYPLQGVTPTDIVAGYQQAVNDLAAAIAPTMR